MQNTTDLKAKIALLEKVLAESQSALKKKDLVIYKQDSVISEKNIAINKLNDDVESLKFQNDQLKRLIFGSKRERFEPAVDHNQLTIEFEPQVAEIEDSVKKEREKIRIEYERKKPKKAHPGRMQLPKNLPVNEIIMEPIGDTTNMVCIGQEVTEELDYTPAKLHINRYIRKKYITTEDEKAEQKQVIAPLYRPIHKCIASTSLLSMIFTNKYQYHMPVYRTRQMLIQLGVTIPDSTLDSWVKLGADLIRPLFAVHRLHVFREIYQMIQCRLVNRNGSTALFY